MDKTRKIPITIDDYIKTFPADVQQILETLRKVIREAAPEAEEAISYQIPTFRLNGNLVHFAGYKKHIGFYPTSSGIEAFKEELSAYEGAKGSVKFPIEKPLPLDLVRKIVAFRCERKPGEEVRKIIASDKIRTDNHLFMCNKKPPTHSAGGFSLWAILELNQ